jgi:hypothetical protein
MSELMDAIASWPTLVGVLLVFGLAPGVVLRLVVLAFKRGDPRRTELLGELRAVPRWERPLWVAEQVEVALFEGVGPRLHAVLAAIPLWLAGIESENASPPFYAASIRIAVTSVASALWAGAAAFCAIYAFTDGSVAWSLVGGIITSGVSLQSTRQLRSALPVRGGWGIGVGVLMRMFYAAAFAALTARYDMLFLLRGVAQARLGPHASVADQLAEIHRLMPSSSMAMLVFGAETMIIMSLSVYLKTVTQVKPQTSGAKPHSGRHRV